MTQFAAELKAEITRLARKEIRTQIQGLRKASGEQRSALAALKRDSAGLKAAIAHWSKRAGTEHSADQPDSGKQVRFSARSVASQRRRLGLSAAEFGQTPRGKRRFRLSMGAGQGQTPSIPDRSPRRGPRPG